MERSRKRKVFVIFILMFTIASLSIGFAAFSGTLNISSSATISASSDLFSVKFSTEKESLVVSNVKPSSITSGITATDGIIDNSTSPIVKNLSVSFTEPGQYVEYTVYARNEGAYIAYLNNVNFIGEKVCESDEMTSNVQSACDSINLKIFVNNEEYLESTRLLDHYLEKNAGEEIIIRIEYDSTGGWADAEFTVKFPDVMMVYSTINDSAFIPEGMDISGPTLLSVISQNVVSDSSLDLSKNPDTTLNNITYIRSGTESQDFPIYYYRGNVTNNNVRFAGFCWKIVRTTDTGGVKIIYNGFPVNGSCNNTGELTHIALSAFNDNTSPTYVGYMYGDVYLATDTDMSSQSATYVYGNDVNWDGSSYTLIDTMSSSSWKSDYSTIQTKYHYTCFNDSGTCKKVYYINSFEYSNKVSYLTLENGINIEDAKMAMFTNKNSSTAKSVIDGWFANYMVSHVDYLEDTVFCNDRRLVKGPLLSKDTNTSARNYFASYDLSIPVLSCTNTKDSFTVNSTNGNGMLTYPVGLLTSSEYKLAGVNDGTYLDNDQTQWTMTPYYFNDVNADMASITLSMTFDNERVEEPKGIRPVVSLKPGIQVFGGDGSATMPYLIIE